VQKIGGPPSARLLLERRESRDHDHGWDRRRELTPQSGQELEPVHSWHQAVRQHQRRPSLPDRVQAGPPRAHVAGAVTIGIEQFRDDLSQFLAVLDDQDLRALGVAVHLQTLDRRPIRRKVLRRLALAGLDLVVLKQRPPSPSFLSGGGIMRGTNLEDTARSIVAEGKGILAADETPHTLTKRFTARAIESNAESRRAYREMFFTTPGIAAFIGGVILQDETIRQRSATGTPLADLLAQRGSSPASRSTPVPDRWPGHPGNGSPKDWTACAGASRSTGGWGRASPSGGR
jgi:hypothetical protein